MKQYLFNVGPDMVGRLESFKQLKDGWYNGSGFAPNLEKLESVIANLRRFPADLPNPFVFPTVEGGILLEWADDGRTSVETRFEQMSGDFMTDVKGQMVECIFDLRAEKGWTDLFNFLKTVFQ